MAVNREPEKTAFFVGVLAASPDILPNVEARLVDKFGPVQERMPDLPFTYTDYYARELGPDPRRSFLAFTLDFDPESLAEAKITTNQLEIELAEGSSWPRPVNLDPGYLAPGKVILASCKDYSHRLYLCRGVYAEVTLQYRDNAFQTLPWTFPDYASGAYFPFFLALRGKLIASRHLSRPPVGTGGKINPLRPGAEKDGNNLEIEAKIPVADIQLIRARLATLGAFDAGKERERNWVFDLPDGSLVATKRLLRLRSLGGYDGILTVKRPLANQEEQAFKTREEVEIRIDSLAACLRQLDILGYQVVWIYEKRRHNWHWRGTVIALDQCPEIGCFVEIEGKPRRIREVCADLGLDPAASLSENYLTLWERHLAARGEGRRNMLFVPKASREEEGDNSKAIQP
ncbi:MAG: DUF4416 family protein [Planctomycetota bacterium]|nr:DUF4416 family protein [Planctomycetota bacterium]